MITMEDMYDYTELMERTIKNLEDWLQKVGADEESVRRACRQIFPSWQLGATGYGVYRRNGWRANKVQLWKDGKLEEVTFYNYDGFFDMY